MDKITSLDGTQIAYYRGGAGSPLVLVHGTGAANPTAWTAVVPTFEKRFTVYAIDRRGRGESSDGSTYAIQREFEDIAAVVDSIGEPALVLGHSFGGLCALEAGLLTRNIHKLVLYEPAIPLPGIPVYPEGTIDRLQALLDAGNREEMVTTFYREVAGIPPHEIDQLRSTPAWAARVASAHTVPREGRALERYTFVAQRFKDYHLPVLLLLGGDSPGFEKAATRTAASALPNAQVVVMPGQQHIAMYTAPDLILREVLKFLSAPG